MAATQTAAEKADAAREKAHKDELAAQKKVQDAIFDATHGKDGEPIPIVVPKIPQEGGGA